MKNILVSNELKWIFFSFVIHSTLLSAVMFYDKEPVKLADKERIVSIDLISYQLPKSVEEVKPKIKPEPKKIEEVKPIPIKEKLKKIEEVKPIPIKEELKKIEEPKSTPIKEMEPIKKEEVKEEPKKMIKQIPIEPKNNINTIEAKREAFIKTNFVIIRDMVLSNLIYPSIAKRMGWQGVVEMKLVVDSRGKLVYYEITKSSGKKQLDEAALSAVESIASTVLPKPNEKTTLILPITFQLR